MIIACVFKNVNKLDSGMRAHQITGGQCHRLENWIRKGMKRFRAFIVFWVPAWMLADEQTNHDSSNAHAQWFFCWKIRADDHDIMK